MARPRIANPNEKFYFTGKPCKRGHIAQRYSNNNECVECIRFKSQLAETKEKRSKYHEANAERINQRHRDYYQENIEKERLRSRNKYKINPDKVLETNKRWMDNNPGYGTYKAAKYRASKRKKTPIWADLNKIKAIYENCPKGYHVDHIVPLRGETVCGLHVPWNLRVIPAFDNISKSNRFETD